MVQSATMGPLTYRSGQEMHARQRAVAFGLVVALHAAVFGGFYLGRLQSPPPPERTLSVSFISESPATPAPTPPQPPAPTPPPPKARMLATTSPTPSPMTAPPLEKQQPEAPPQPAPPTPQPPAVAPAAPPTEAVYSPPSFKAAYLNNPGAVYPYASRLKHQEGTVLLRVKVSAEGAPSQVVVERSSKFSDLDAAAVDVVKKRWRFVPAKQGDRALAGDVLVPMEFSLKDR